MTKKELCKRVSELTNIPQREVELISQLMFAEIQKVLVDRDTLLIPGFGKFSTKVRHGHPFVHPTTKERIMTKDVVCACFAPSSTLKKAIRS